MRSFLLSCMLLAAGFSSVVGGTPFSRGLGASNSLFGIPRGGGLFGGKDQEKEAVAADGDRQKFPAMTQGEIEDWLEHIPVFAVTDSQGSGVVLKPDNDTSVFYFFLSPMQANATLQQLKGTNSDMDLKVSAFSLGKIWFGLLQSGADKEVTLKAPGDSEGTTATGVEYRLVPDSRDLLGARMLLTMKPEDGEKLKDEGMTPEIAQETLQRAMQEAPKFNSSYNEIPVFTIAQMRMQKKPEDGDEGEAITMLPMYFSLQNMVGTWQQFMSTASPELQGVEPAINLMSLHELVDLMQQESEVDWRNVVLVPGMPNGQGGGPGEPVAPQPTGGGMASMGGATLDDVS
ncbi:expressed unknown protein [Seminavis robusta]|uniref:Uncharacterized protein n=1 Tax=Seminavis robusta TaxID=568900 RepID=A0A9N8H9B4_9STRA|nr:expressed unknown protein [Seminavis robusta]|eukprot:Sro185_g080480.1 n/a (345) ;mRNA; r:87206-88471